MKFEVTPAILLVLFAFTPATFGENAQAAVDKTMMQTEPVVIDHPALDVLSFLVGRWKGEDASCKVDENWTESDGSMIVLRKKTFPNHQIETEMILMESGPHGAFGRSQSFDYNLRNLNHDGIALPVRLKAYSPNSAEFDFGNESRPKRIVYKMIGANEITVDTGVGKLLKLNRIIN